MGIKDQVNKLKENWLLLVIALVVLVVALGGGSLFQGDYVSYAEPSFADRSFGIESAGLEAAPPAITERKIITTTSMSNEVEAGQFQEAAAQVKSIITASDSILVNEKVTKFETAKKSFYSTGRYQIKVDVTKYDSVVEQLKNVGELQSFNENKQDVTERVEDAEIELQVAKDRLARYESLYRTAKEVEDQIQLTDLIFEQERRIQYMEDALKNVGKRIDYATIHVTLKEEKSDFADVKFIDFTVLLTGLADSFNALLAFLFVIAPWALLIWLIRVIWKKAKKKK